MKIGIFDSRIGGMTVLTQLRLRWPGFDYVYLGDTAYLPYGNKNMRQIQKRTLKCAQYLMEKKVNWIVLACHTASALAFEKLQMELNSIPITGMIQSSVKKIFLEWQKLNDLNAPILILGTKATIKSKIYLKELQQLNPQPVMILEKACPLLIPLIEEGWVTHPALEVIVQDYLLPFQKFKKGIIFLACTHYSWIMDSITSILPQWKIIDSSKVILDELSPFFPNLNDLCSRGKIQWNFSNKEAISPFGFREIERLNRF